MTARTKLAVHWRDHATAVRLMAGRLRKRRSGMIGIALQYQQLAERADWWAAHNRRVAASLARSSRQATEA